MVYGDLKNVEDVIINPVAGKVVVVTRKKEDRTIHKYTADKNRLNDIIMINMLTDRAVKKIYEISANWYTTKYIGAILDVPEDLKLTADNFKEPDEISWIYLY